MRTGKPYETQPGEIYISPESMAIFKALHAPQGLEGVVSHKFVGRSDRWCEVCDKPDRHPIHIKGPTHYPVTGLGFVTKEWAELFLENWSRALKEYKKWIYYDRPLDYLAINFLSLENQWKWFNLFDRIAHGR